MNNSELEKKLIAAKEPRLEAEYQAAFAGMVLAKLRSDPQKGVSATHQWRTGLIWGLATAACMVLALVASHWHGRLEAMPSPEALLENTNLIQETLGMFPHQVQAIVQDEHGINLVLSDKDDVPASTPIYVRICNGKNCSSVVTFSGQVIQVAGQKLTVLSEADGGIILEGNKFLWSNDQKVYAGGNLKIEAKNLGAVAM